MSLSARRVLRSSCHIAVLPSHRSTVITESPLSDELVDPTHSVDEQTLPVDSALINGAEHPPHQYVSAATISYLTTYFLSHNLFCCYYVILLFDLGC